MVALMERAGAITAEGEGWRSLVRLSSLGDDLFLHSAYPTTGTDAVFFGPDTYRFCTAIREWLDRNPGPLRRVADIGSGAGPGGILVARAAPAAETLLIDINPEALRLAAINARLAGTANVRPALSNLLADLPGAFDLIIANPPYLLDAARREYRHGGGTLGEGLAVAIVAAAPRGLRPAAVCCSIPASPSSKARIRSGPWPEASWKKPDSTGVIAKPIRTYSARSWMAASMPKRTGSATIVLSATKPR